MRVLVVEDHEVLARTLGIGLRREGMAVADAVIQGSILRLRPVLITASVAALGLTPMLFASGPGSEIQKPLAAVVIGGTRLSGGRGSITGTILGTLIIGVLTNMLRLNNVDSNLEMMIKAVIIILAVVVQRERKPA